MFFYCSINKILRLLMVIVQAVWCHHWMPLMLMSERSGREIEGWMVGREGGQDG